MHDIPEPPRKARPFLVHSAASNSIYEPLAGFYHDLRLAMPALEGINAGAVPQPFRGILVHDRDMTPTLTAAYGKEIRLRVLQFQATADFVRRLVVLVLDDERIKPVCIGAIRIHRSLLPEPAQQQVMDSRKPFGAILQDTGVTHRSHPTAFFRVAADDIIAGEFRTSAGVILYGRRNTIWNSAGSVLAEVIEILPEAEDRT